MVNQWRFSIKRGGWWIDLPLVKDACRRCFMMISRVSQCPTSSESAAKHQSLRRRNGWLRNPISADIRSSYSNFKWRPWCDWLAILAQRLTRGNDVHPKQDRFYHILKFGWMYTRSKTLWLHSSLMEVRCVTSVHLVWHPQHPTTMWESPESDTRRCGRRLLLSVPLCDQKRSEIERAILRVPLGNRWMARNAIIHAS